VTVVTRRWCSRLSPEPVDLHFLEEAPRSRSFGGRRSARERVQRAVALPDKTGPFWRSAVPQALKIGREVRPDLVLTSSPPPAIHLLGRAIKQDCSVPWVADLRDPMVGDPRYGSGGLRPLRRRTLDRFEADLVADADLLTVAIPSAAASLASRYPSAADKVQVITNGFPAELIDVLQKVPTKPLPPRITSVGKIGGRELLRLSSAVQMLRTAGDLCPLLVVVTDRSPAVRQAERLLGPGIDAPGQLPHRDALGYVASATVLVSALDVQRSQTGGLSSRLFEYVATGQSIVAVNPTSEDRSFLAPYGAILLTEPEAGDLASALDDALQRAGTSSTAPLWLEEYRTHYQRAGQVQMLAERLEVLLR